MPGRPWYGDYHVRTSKPIRYEVLCERVLLREVHRSPTRVEVIEERPSPMAIEYKTEERRSHMRE